ncbi:hypothetical protein KCG44_10530 [Pacificimonas sp. WHA3]|uniref:Uncharacterized protein n=1 Tax=Pacificimonas pallii TaxID=2827236 RepID=A0ABS6SFM5_9SPHN|nr:hypothetical protein [Pacificimonas pallii]MBV7257217.1 hypothetical protein [Pacificimonas pallii]
MSKFGTIGLGIVTIGAGLGLYLSSYHVGEERDRISDLQAQMREDTDRIAKLQAEIGARSSLARLEMLNASLWNYHAPKPGQIVGGPRAFAAAFDQSGAAALHLAVVDDAAVTATPARVAAPVRTVAVAESAAEVPRPLPVAAPPADQQARQAPKETTFAAAELAQADPVDLFSDNFIADVDTAATLERAGFQKVSLR